MGNIFITGATGFIGGHLARANLALDHRVSALVLDDDPGADPLRQAGADICYGDVCRPESLRKAVAGAEVVYHCAGVVTDWAPRRLFSQVTVQGTENVCRAALDAGVKRLVYISTNDVFGLDESRILDETCPLRPWREPYPDFKIQAEEIAWRYYREHGLPVAMVYPCWVYGPGDLTFVPLLADAIVKKEMLFWRRDVLVWPTYVDNLVDLMLHLAVNDRAIGNGYLVHDGRSTTLQEFCAAIAEFLEAKPPTRHIPYPAAYTAALVLETLWKLLRRSSRPLLTTYTVKNLGSRLRFSIDKAARELDWQPPVSFASGLQETLMWLQTLDHDQLKGK